MTGNEELMDHHVQIGIVPLTLDIGFVPANDQPWKPVTVDFLKSGIFGNDSIESTEVLCNCFRDPGLHTILSSKVVKNEVLVRVSLFPSDSPGSTWNKASIAQKAERKRNLQRLFGLLKQGWETVSDLKVFGADDEDFMRMPELYASIPSPEINFSEANTYKDQDLHARLRGYEDLVGVRATLHQYQTRSVAMMIQMETEPRHLVDPYFHQLFEAGRPQHSEYYINLHTWVITKHPGRYDLPRGGILCEQMGTGKTLMCLALIVSTRHHACLPPRDKLDLSPIITTHSLNAYPFEDICRIREAAGLVNTVTAVRRSGVPSLADLCASILATKDPSLRKDSSLPAPLRSLLRRHDPVYFDLPATMPGWDDCARAKKRKPVFVNQKIHLANTTLVVVPDILVPQWIQEIETHLDANAIEIYVHRTGDLPSIEKLVKYDIILMDLMRFSYESSPYRAARELGPSVLLEARWKRIIFDEGHVAGSKTSNAMLLAAALNSERRWVVSGTPTRNLRQGTGAQSSSDRKPLSGITKWSKNDIDDAERLGVIIGHFLGAEPFKSTANETKFSQSVISPLRHRNGPHLGAVRRMRQILSKVLVKHQPGTIEREAIIPPLTVSTRTLRFDPMQRLTYNVLAALITANVYDSNFEDEDYFLHPKNKALFNQVIANLHLACFWFSAAEMDAEGALERIDEMCRRDDWPAERMAVIQEAGHHIRKALRDGNWSEWMAHAISLPFKVDKLPDEIEIAFSDSALGTGENDLIDTSSLLLLRQLNVKGQTMDVILARAAALRQEKNRALMTQAQAEEEKRADREHQQRLKPSEKSTKAAQQPTRLKVASSSKSKILHNEEDAMLDKAKKNAQAMALAHLPRLIPSTITVTSRSAKINAVLASIKGSPHDKFVIFGDNFELGHLTEALDLAEISSCFAGHSVNRSARINAIKLFETTGTQVCLLDLKLAARGLNLVCANRMIFLAPVWSQDVQAQAIKRVHRIGQTRPTKVEILVIEGTFEEDIVNRSSATRSEEEEILYSRAMIENPRFVHLDTNRSDHFLISMIPVQDRQYGPPPSPLTPSSEDSGSSPSDRFPITPVRSNFAAVPSTEWTSPLQRAAKRVYDSFGQDDAPLAEKRARVTFADPQD